MLKELRIANLGVVEKAELNFLPGLTVLTGETGAGKTMIIHALNQSIGNRSDSSLIRDGAQRFVVESVWAMDNTQFLANPDFDIELEDGELTLSKTVDQTGKGKSLINGITSNGNAVSAVSDQLIQIFGQNDQRLLSKPSWQLAALDSMGGLTHSGILTKYRDAFEQFVSLSSDLKQLKIRQDEILKNKAQLIAALAEFDEIAPVLDEDDAILEQIKVFEKYESEQDLYRNIQKILDSDGIEASINDQLGRLMKLVSQAADLDAFGERLPELLISLEDLSLTVSNRLAYAADGISLDDLNTRRATLNALIRKYGTPLNEIIAQMQSNRAALENALEPAVEIAKIETEIKKAQEVLISLAVEINQSRQVLAESLQKAITHELHDLKMPEAVFNCQITALKQADIELDFMFFDRNGMDEISFLLGHGADGNLKPIAKTASGGELSRIMLAMQVVLTENQPEITYIFDEVDAGIGGETAIEVGKRLARLATRQQVIVVTHLPQVAAFADHHFAITGNVTAGIKISDVQLLDQQARETEIARMLGGIKTSAAALQHARELLTLKE